MITDRQEKLALEILQEHEKKDLLRFVTAGSVDDGKSTLIGRLLYESKGIYEDQLAGIRSASGRRGTTGIELDLSLVTDGLKAEREQGITIDVAYRYFSTPTRKFIIADTPGHEQYTRNTATGASTANLAIVLVDATLGVLTQSRRHAFIASLLGIPHLVVTVNKMDLVDWSQEVFDRIVDEFTSFAAKLEISDVTFIPISALLGDNVVERSANMPWYKGTTLLNHLETVHIASDRNFIDLRFPVQYVSRPTADFRGYMGTVASGVVRPGDEILVLPSGRTSRVEKVLDGNGEEMTEAFPPHAATLTLKDHVDISRGDMLVHVRNVPHMDRRFDAMIIWMSEEPMQPGRQYTIKHTTKMVQGLVTDIRWRIDVNTLHRQPADVLNLNEIARCAVETARPIAYDPYRKNRQTGSFILIDRITNGTVGAGVILDREASALHADPAHRVRRPRSEHVQPHASDISPDERRQRLGQSPATLWLTGLTGSGKSTIAFALEKRLFAEGFLAGVLDGSNVRLGINKDLGFAADERAEHVRRVAEVARVLNETGLVGICSLLSPSIEDRRLAAEIVGPDRFLEIYLSAPLEVCRERAPQGLYEKAESGEVEMFSGVSAPYEPPTEPDLTLPTDQVGVEECVDRIVDLLRQRGILPPAR